MAVNVLISYGVQPKADLAAVHAAVVCGRVMVDSGAFTAHSTGRTIRLEEYAAHLERWRGHWHHAITLDVIGDPAASARNTRRLHERGLPVMPVFTLGARLAEFDAMIADAGYVAVGGMVGVPLPAVRDRAAMLQRRARAAGGGIHLLGNGSMRTLRVVRPYSADTSSVSSMFRFGNLLYFDGVELRQVNLQHRVKLAAARDHLAAQGVDLAPLLRARRMPGGDARLALNVALSWSYVCADEVLRRSQVSLARQPEAPSGTHLYLALANDGDLAAARTLARTCHERSGAPRAWQRWGARHDCPYSSRRKAG